MSSSLSSKYPFPAINIVLIFKAGLNPIFVEYSSLLIQVLGSRYVEHNCQEWFVLMYKIYSLAELKNWRQQKRNE